MTEAERLQLGEKRRLIFSNIANGVPVETVMAAFFVSELEVHQAIGFVGRKIKEYRFRRASDGSKFMAPPIACETVADARLNRLAALETLSKVGNLYLSSELLLPKINIQRVTESDIPEIEMRMRGKT